MAHCVEHARRLQGLKAHLWSFIELAVAAEPEPGGVTNVEAFWWWALVAHYEPEVILESGINRGRSTEVLARAAQRCGAAHYAFDCDTSLEREVRFKLREYVGTTLIYRDSAAAVKALAPTLAGKRVVAIIDGPKSGKPLLDLYQTLAPLNLCALGQHDCYPQSPGRRALLQAVAATLPTGDLLFTEGDEGLGWLNQPLRGHLDERWRQVRDRYQRKFGVGDTVQEYEHLLAQVGLLFIEP